jgi:RimJ/RimL family protein N-acetyltransferase
VPATCSTPRSESRFTDRLRLEPIGPAQASDFWSIHNDDEVVPWYDGWRPSVAEAEERARFMADSWRLHGVHKWMAYDRMTGGLVGRGGLSRAPMDDDWGRLEGFLPAESWVREAHESELPFRAYANWLEIGWALRRDFWGNSYASEIGRAGLAFAFHELEVQAVVSCTRADNARSRAVMDRIGMRYAGELPNLRPDEPADAVCILLREDWLTQRG